MLAFITAATIVVTPHVRSTDSVIGAVLTDSLRRSATIRRLVELIDASNVIVYLARGDLPRPAVACLMMAGGRPDTRYVRINFRLPEGLGRARAWHSDELSTEIAHELQHAAEIAGWPEVVVDGASLEAAYRRSGRHRGGEQLDTDAAILAGDARRAELRDRRR